MPWTGLLKKDKFLSTRSLRICLAMGSVDLEGNGLEHSGVWFGSARRQLYGERAAENNDSYSYNGGADITTLVVSSTAANVCFGSLVSGRCLRCFMMQRVL